MDNDDVLAFPDAMVNDSNDVRNVNPPKSPWIFRKRKIDSGVSITSPSLQKSPKMLRKDRVDSDKMGNIPEMAALNTQKSPRTLRKERVDGEENLTYPKMAAYSTDASKQIVEEMISVAPDNMLDDMERTGTVPKMEANSTNASKQVVEEMISVAPDNLLDDMEHTGTVPKMAANSTDASKQVVEKMRSVAPDNLLDDMERMGNKSPTIAADIHQFDHDDLLDDMEHTATKSTTIVAEKEQGLPSLAMCLSTLKFPPPSNEALASVWLATGSAPKHVRRAQCPKRATKQSGRQTTSPIRKTGAPTVNDEFIGKLVAFYLDSTVGKDIVTFFGSKWSMDAICYDANKLNSHVVDMVMQKVKAAKVRNCTKGVMGESYNIAWEYSSLGVTALNAHHLSAASVVGCHIKSLQKQASQKSSNSRVGQPQQMKRIEAVSRAMSKLTTHVSDEESFCCAPSSDSESSHDKATDNVSESNDEIDNESDNDFINWIIFDGNKGNVNLEQPNSGDDSRSLDSLSQEKSGTMTGLHWDTSHKINDPPCNSQRKGCSVKLQ